MILELKNKDINKFKYIGSSNDFFNCCDISEEHFNIVFNLERVIFDNLEYGIIFNSEFVIFDILCNIIEETYGE
jgi:hypothetical protein